MKILLHICCGPCASWPLPWLQSEGHEVYGLFFNPNIHPYTEYEKRRGGARQLAEKHQTPLVLDQDYDPTPYLQAVTFREGQRCTLCYQLRMQKAAQIAQHGNFDGFTTSLLVSPYQKHDLLRQVGENCGNQHSIPFLYFDWRENYKDTVKISKEMGLYRQPYCGCLFSEWERYGKKKGG